MLGEYLWRALDDVRQRPMFRVMELVGNLEGADQPRSVLYPPPSIFANDESATQATKTV
jgi:hypothetical protein